MTLSFISTDAIMQLEELILALGTACIPTQMALALTPASVHREFPLENLGTTLPTRWAGLDSGYLKLMYPELKQRVVVETIK